MKRKGVLCFIKKDNKVLMILVSYGDKSIWNGVSGFIDSGENSKEAVIREIKEEIGITVDVSSLQFKGTHVVSEELSLEVFTTTKWEGVPASKEESIKEVQWFKIDKLPFEQMFPDNKDWVPELIK